MQQQLLMQGLPMAWQAAPAHLQPIQLLPFPMQQPPLQQMPMQHMPMQQMPMQQLPEGMQSSMPVTMGYMTPVPTPPAPAAYEQVHYKPLSCSTSPFEFQASHPEDMFDRLDTNHDGVLTRDEFQQLHVYPTI